MSSRISRRGFRIDDTYEHRDTISRQRYNNIVVFIVDLGSQTKSQRVVEFRGKWHKYNHGGDQWDDTIKKRPFNLTLNQQRLEMVLKQTHLIAELKSKIGSLAKAQTSVEANVYVDMYDQYLRVLLELHEAISSQATVVLDLLREIESTRDILNQAKDVEVYDLDSKKYIRSVSPADLFPSSSPFPVGELELEAVKSIWTHHRQLYTYIARIRAEIVNCLADSRDLSIDIQNHTLMSMSAALGPAPLKDRGVLLRHNATIYNVDDQFVDPDDDTVPTGLGRWCHVSKEYHDQLGMENAHIIPAATQESTITRIFGDPDPTMVVNSPRNFLFMHRNIEKAFDRGQISVVPADMENEHTDVREFRLWFLDRRLITTRSSIYYGGNRWCDLAKSPKLGFQNSFRPGLRNLYWHNVTSLAKAKQAAFPGYVEALAEFEKIWAPVRTSEWIARPVLEGLAAAFGIPEIAQKKVYLNEAQVDTLNILFTISALQWQPPHRRKEIVDLDEEGIDDEFDYEYMDLSSFVLSPMGIRSPDESMRMATFYDRLVRQRHLRPRSLRHHPERMLIIWPTSYDSYLVKGYVGVGEKPRESFSVYRARSKRN